MSGWLEGYVALVTGAASGLGRAVVERYVEEGASVTLVDRDPDRLKRAVEESSAPDRLHAVVADVRAAAELQQAVAETVDRFGQLDTLVANAGVWDFHRQLTRLSADELERSFDEVFAINVKGYLLAAHAAWPELVKSRGSIVMTLSNASSMVNGGGPVYTASKHAALGLMRELAWELAPKVRVNGVACGAMSTDLRGPESLDLGERSIGASFARQQADDRPPIPLHDSSTDPRDFTGPYVLLASREQAGQTTGHAIAADGGMAVRGFRSDAGGDHL